MTKQIVSLPKFGRDAEVRAASYDEAENTVEVIWTTGAAVRRYSWREGVHYNEILEVTPEAVRLDRLNAGAPLLDAHMDYSLWNVIGAVVPGSARIEGGKGYAKVKLSSAAGDADTVGKIKDGIIRNISVGYAIHRVEKTVIGEGQDEEWRVVDWEPLEISAVPIPADPGSQIRKTEQGVETPCEIYIRTPDADASAGTNMEVALSETIPAEAEVAKPDANDNPTNTEARVAETVIETRAAPAAAVDTETATRVAAKASEDAIVNERKRAAAIRKLAREAEAVELGDEHIESGSTEDAFRSALLDHLMKREAPAVDNRAPARVGTEHAEKRAAIIESVIMHRIDPAKNKLPEGGGEFRGMTLTDMARESLEAAGVRTRGMSKVEIASEALAQRSGGMHSTSDFSVILGNTVNRTLRAAYEAAPQTFRPLVRETTVSDFKTVTRAQLGEAPQLEKVNEHGEFKRGTIGEGSESYRIATFGKIVGITRQALINDDLGAFSRLAQMFGVQAAQLESDLVWYQILSNPTMGDSVALFHLASHKNLQSAAAFSKTTLSVMRAAMAKQKGVDGKTVLNIRPAFLMIPVDLETSADELLRTVRYPDATTNAVSDTLKSLTIIAEPRIDNGIDNASIGAAVAGSSTAHYLAASPSQTDTIELAYLEGNRGVYTESKMGFNTDGVEIKVRLDAGAKAIDWRAFQKNAGA